MPSASPRISLAWKHLLFQILLLQASHARPGPVALRASHRLSPQTIVALGSRGGQTSQNPYHQQQTTSPPPSPQQQQQRQYPDQYNNVPGSYDDTNTYYGNSYDIPGGEDAAAAEHLFQESVQDRVDRWRETQLAQSQSRTQFQEMNPRDEQGRMKLIASVSKGSRAFIFFVLMWRDIHLFETADQIFKKGGVLRLFAVIPLTLLFIGNLAGVVASITSPGHATKKRMKAILNLDKIVEILLLGWYFLRLTILPSRLVPREIYVANVLHSVFFLIQCQAFTRVTW